jgi:serine protease Do
VPATAWSTSAPSTLAGAQLIALDDDLREVLARGAGADPDAGPVRGVFVLKVLPGPAASAGLRAGDVVTAADGRLVASPAALQRVLAGRALGAGAAERRAVPLRVWRAGAARDVVLRW